MYKPGLLWQYANIHLGRWRHNRHIQHLAAEIYHYAYPNPKVRPIIFFNASTRLAGVSLNAAFSLLTSWAIRLQNVPVVYFVCQRGMSRCVLGTDQQKISKPPPCQGCTAQSRWLFSDAQVAPFKFHEDAHLVSMLQGLSLNELMDFTGQPSNEGSKIHAEDLPAHLPLGRIVLSSVRWALRRHTLHDDEATRFLYCQYILSANSIAQRFSELLDQVSPQAVILFNGQFFPEATARWLALQRGIRTITHEVGLQALSAFFTTGEATAYPLQVPDSFELNDEQNARLDAYLSQRFQGQFTMAGIHFWPDMKRLDQAFLDKASSFRQIVPVFTNVIFDTSQPHSNVVFPHMFAWLDLVQEIISSHPETLFVIRSHPDEVRPGKTSQESVSQWVAQNHADALPNLIFVDSNQSLSSYELIHHSKFVMVYNSTIGLEASILGAPVLCAGRARYTQLPTVFFPSTPQEFRQQAENFLTIDQIDVPSEFKRNARRFLYYQLFRSSLSFAEFITPDLMPGFVRLRPFTLEKLIPENSPIIKVLVDGILNGKPFLLDDGIDGD